MKFSDQEIKKMQRELAVNGYLSMLRLIVLHDPKLSTTTKAHRDLSIYCNASGTTAYSWLERGMTECFVERALEYCESYSFVISRHQLAPTKQIAINWLNYELRAAAEKTKCKDQKAPCEA